MSSWETTERAFCIVPYTDFLRAVLYDFFCSFTNAHHGLHHDRLHFPTTDSSAIGFCHALRFKPAQCDSAGKPHSKHGTFYFVKHVVDHNKFRKLQCWDTYDRVSVFYVLMTTFNLMCFDYIMFYVHMTILFLSVCMENLFHDYVILILWQVLYPKSYFNLVLDQQNANEWMNEWMNKHIWRPRNTVDATLLLDWLINIGF